MLNSTIWTYGMCFVGKVCGPLWSTWGAPMGVGKSGTEAGIVNTKKRAGRAQGTRWQPPPPLCMHAPGRTKQQKERHKAE